MTTENKSEILEPELEPLDRKTRWLIPQKLDLMSFIGKDVLAVAFDMYILFLNLRTGLELVYVADGPENGDGVDVVSGYKSNVFVFAEKVSQARIFIMNYPTFNIVGELKDTDVNRYKGLCLMEGELVAAFSGFPNYTITVWSWRSGQRLLMLPTEIIRRRQIFSVSRSHTMVCQCHGQGLIVWEVAPCFRKCFLMRRAKDSAADWDVPEAPLVAAAWTNEGQLFVIDSDSKFYSGTTDNVKMQTVLEWELEGLKGDHKPLMCALGSGFLIYGPDPAFRWLKVKDNKKWFLKWTQPLGRDDEVLSLVGSAGAENAVAWTSTGRVLRIMPPAGPTAALMAAAAGQPTGATTATATRGRAFSNRGKAPKSRAGRAAAAAAANAESDAAAAAAAAQAAAAAAAAAAEEANPEIRLFTYKQRNIIKVKLLAPDNKHVVTMNATGELCIYEVLSAKMVLRTQLTGRDQVFQTSPVDPLLAVIGAQGANYGLTLLRWDESNAQLTPTASTCLTHQIVSRAIFSRNGTHLIAAAMSAGHLFIYKVTSPDHGLKLVRYSEIGRGLADCFLMKVGEFMRAFALVLFSDKFLLGERIVCINADTGKDNKFAGKMKGPYCVLQSLVTKDTMLAIPHLSRDFHILKLAGDKGTTVAVKMGPIILSGHELKLFRCSRSLNALVTFGADGAAILRKPDGSPEYDYKLQVTHRYESGVRNITVDNENDCIAHLAHNQTAGITYLHARPEINAEVRHDPPDSKLFDDQNIDIFDIREKNYLDLLEDKKVHDEATNFKKQRRDVVRLFHELQEYLVELLEENINEIPLHQLSLSEFNLHLEFKKERLKQAEIQREKIRLETEARIKAQNKVTAWIKEKCWNSMLTPRVKIFAIFSHYQVENYPVLPTQRDLWPELQQTSALRTLEMEIEDDVFRPWDEESLIPKTEAVKPSVTVITEEEEDAPPLADHGNASETQRETLAVEEVPEEREPYVLSGTGTHKYITVPPFMIPQTTAFSFLQMNYLYQIVKLNVQNMRLWFNKKFDELMAQKRRECGLVGERNARLRFILSELNKLSDLRGSFHYIMIQIKDPEWRQEEEPNKLTKVEVSECTISPYTSQILVIPPELGPKDDFRERALNEMMDGVLEKLWHEEIKKPIPKPQCMLDKDPEHWNEEDLKKVFDYEAKVKFREGEREKYRRMLHAEYAKLSQTLNEGIVKFNAKVKDMWLTKLKVDSVIGQENLNLMRLRRTNLDRVEAAEELENVRDQILLFDKDVEYLQTEMDQIHEQGQLCQQAYDAFIHKDRQLDRTFKNNFSDYSQLIVDQCYKFYKKRPKWYQRASMIPTVLNELAVAIGTNTRPPMLHPDCLDYVKGVEQLDLISNMPAVLDEALWATMCRLRRIKIDNEIRIRAMVMDMAYVDQSNLTWTRALQARRSYLQQCHSRVQLHRERVIEETVNRTMQLVLPAGHVEIETTGRMVDFDDAMLLPRADVEAINQLILKVGEIKLRLLRRQIEFRKGILQKEWEHAQMKMKLRHMQQELYFYARLKIPKELQKFLKDKEQGFTDEDDYKLLEKEMAATKMLIERVLSESAQIAEELEVKISKVNGAYNSLEHTMDKLMVQVSEKRIREDALEPIRIRRVLKKRMETLVARSALIREVQARHTRIVILQTELELMRLKTYPTLAPFRTLC